MDEEKVQNFAIRIQKVTKPDGQFSFSVDSRNEGISDAEVILIVDAWLTKVKEAWQGKIKEQIVFMNEKK